MRRWSEHLTVLGYRAFRVSVENPWFEGASEVKTFVPEELLATKLRALYQREKGRDLFDLAVAMTELSQLDAPKLVECFETYLNHSGTRISRAEFEANLAEKIADPAFTTDVTPLLSVAGARARVLQGRDSPGRGEGETDCAAAGRALEVRRGRPTGETSVRVELQDLRSAGYRFSAEPTTGLLRRAREE